MNCNHVLRGCEQFAGAYIDDVITFSSTWKDHLNRLKEVLKRFQEAGLTVKPSIHMPVWTIQNKLSWSCYRTGSNPARST